MRIWYNLQGQVVSTPAGRFKHFGGQNECLTPLLLLLRVFCIFICLQPDVTTKFTNAAIYCNAITM